MIKIKIQTSLKRLLFSELFQPKQLLATYAAARGAVIDEVIPEMRRTAKIVNFGLLYGAGPFRMSQELGIPQKEAKSIIESYFERYSGIKDYIDSVIEYARANKYVKTILGRRRQVWDIDSNNHLHKEAAKRMGIQEGTITILIHCGSRGFGHQVCSDYLRISEQVQEKGLHLLEAHQSEYVDRQV